MVSYRNGNYRRYRTRVRYANYASCTMDGWFEVIDFEAFISLFLCREPFKCVPCPTPMRALTGTWKTYPNIRRKNLIVSTEWKVICTTRCGQRASIKVRKGPYELTWTQFYTPDLNSCIFCVGIMVQWNGVTPYDLGVHDTVLREERGIMSKNNREWNSQE